MVPANTATRGTSAEARGDQSYEGDDEQCGHQHPLLRHEPAQPRRQEVAEKGPRQARHEDHAEPERGDATGLTEAERDQEGEEPDDAPQDRHRGRGKTNTGRAQLLPLIHDSRRIGIGHPMQAKGSHRAAEEHSRSQSQHPVAAEEGQLQHDDTRCRDRETGDDCEHGEARVRVDQVLLALDDRRHERAPGDEVGLREHEHRERLGKQPEAVQVVRHREADEGAARGGQDHDGAPAGAAPVEHRSEQGADHRERRHGEKQVEDHLAAGGAGLDREEQRIGKRHRDEGVARIDQGMDQREPGEGRRAELHRRGTGRSAKGPPAGVGRHQLMVRPGPVPLEAHLTQGFPPDGRNSGMADLSNLLGDVYGDDPDGEPVRREPPAEGRSAAPAWADESVLDAAFANWTPGPPLDAPAAERAVFAPSTDPAGAAPLPDDLAAALSAALVGAPPPEVALGAASAGGPLGRRAGARHIGLVDGAHHRVFGPSSSTTTPPAPSR